MRIKLAGVAVVVVGLLAAAAAYAGSTTTFTVTATGSKNAGTQKKPKPFKGSFFYGASGPGGARAPAPVSWAWSWEGVKLNGKHFPTCTAAEIDAAQSDASCPAKSLIGEAPTVAKLGPEVDPNTNVECLGKTIRFYNSGTKAIAIFIVGPADQCAGVAYLPPFEASVGTKKARVAVAAKKGKEKASTSTLTMPFPDNITHPLPGLAGGLSEMDASFIQRKKKVKGKKVAFMESTGCKGQREFTFTTVDEEGTHVDKTDAGKCKK